ncbi:hypothetical protein VA7868_04340 [Vibrio aerogenes CECT 7868]|uniref:Alpha-acetolactate decarboxylase n=1 Tax=Vibrio aerogenes CECT 7868 TaxID=1216006 RepID=A0A1M6DWS3_9VIBR|nr:DUF2913 family protein [Vibrio aerogenes]SHI77714.1 hypothetical protein VA7868_04340 [Vibrio aerogenes CECT 7868]
MSLYSQEICSSVQTALEELAQAHQQGKLADAPLPNQFYLVRWITKSLKQQRFPRCVSDDFVRWQKAGRSKGNQIMLEPLFRKILAYYDDFFQSERCNQITDKRIELFLDEMEAAGWEVSTSEALVGCGKVQLFTEQPDSLAICSGQCESCFDGELLVHPMSLFVRGNHARFVELAWRSGFMVHKRTDYKSNVKYHGEYLIYPGNRGEQLAELPSGFE